MKIFSSLITESQVINASMKAWKTLSYEAQSAIDKWESSNWKGGPLEFAFQQNTDIAKEIVKAFEPVKAFLPQKVMLYRGIWKDKTGTYDHSGRVLESWTDHKPVADYFAGRGYLEGDRSFKNASRPTTSTAEIDRLVASYYKNGFVSWKNWRLVRNPNNSQYFNIWKKGYHGYEFITDGDHDNVRDFFTSEEEYKHEWNRDILARGDVLEESIDKNAIVWLTNNLKCHEYIVKVNR